MVKQTISEKDADIILKENNIEKKRQLIKKILSEVNIQSAADVAVANLKLQAEIDTKYDILIEEMIPSEALDDTKKLGIEELSDN